MHPNITIALASANEAALIAASTHLLEVATARGVRLNLLQGVKTAQEAQAIYHEGGELWALGEIASAYPELPSMVDRVIPDRNPDQLLLGVYRAFTGFINKTRIAA